MQNFFLNLGNLIKLSYWFDLSPDPFMGNVGSVLYFIFVLFVIFGFVCKIQVKRFTKNIPLRNTWLKFEYFFTTIGFLGVIFVFFRKQMIYFLGAPFWLGLLFVTAVIWLIFIYRYIKNKVPKIREEILTRKELEKYLPKKNK